MMRRITALVIAALMTVCIFAPFAGVRADNLINLSVRATNTEPGIGDIVTVSVIADNFPKIVRFGTMKIHYDDALAEYVSVELGGDISNFVYNVTQDGSYINISAVDQYFSETGNEEDSAVPPEDQAIDIASNTVLFLISFRIRQGASGQIPFWIDTSGDFINASGENVSTVVDNSISVTISDKVSDDANLVNLRISNTELEPAFSPDITDYQATVERQVTDAVVTADPSNLWASVVINGSNNLQLGANLISVIVTAQDGVTTKEYRISLTRRESYLPNNAVLADARGVTYTMLDVPSSFTPPDGFTQKIRTVNEYSVPAYVRDGMSSVLLYLYDGENPPGLYLYNPELKTVVPYVKEDTIVRKSVVLIKAEIPAEVKIPKDFAEEVREINGVTFNGFVNGEGDFVCYLSDEAGNCDFYRWDNNEGMFIRYSQVDRTAEKAYSALMIVFMIMTAVEAFFLVVIVVVVHRVLSRRKNPRPKHV